MLGNECNLQCKYCLQHDIVEDQVVHEINPDIYSYVSKIARYQRKPLHITFFGGEPLIFWHQIEQFVTRLECQNITFGIISNGVALTEDRVAWLNQHNIRFALSWDGDNVMETRGFDAVRDRRNLLLKLNRLILKILWMPLISSMRNTVKYMPITFLSIWILLWTTAGTAATL